MLRVNDGPATLGLFAWAEADKEGAERLSRAQARAVHSELSTDDLDGLYADLLAKGVAIDVPPHDEPWERAMTAFDPDGYSGRWRRSAAARTNKSRVRHLGRDC